MAAERAQRAKLAAILRRAIDTTFDGERDNALRAAHRLADALGGWDQALGVEPTLPPASWRVQVATLLRQPASLTEWERKFLASIAIYPADRVLSEKQLRLLTNIVEQAAARAPGRAA